MSSELSIENVLTPAEALDDPVSKALLARGYCVTPYRLGKKSLAIGTRVALGDAELVYRVRGDTLTIIAYRHRGAPRGLSNLFAEALWFIEFLRTHDVGVRRVVTTAARLRRADGRRGPDPRRLTALYKRCFGARTLEWRNQSEWLVLDLEPSSRPVSDVPATRA